MVVGEMDVSKILQKVRVDALEQKEMLVLHRICDLP